MATFLFLHQEDGFLQNVEDPFEIVCLQSDKHLSILSPKWKEMAYGLVLLHIHLNRNDNDHAE